MANISSLAPRRQAALTNAELFLGGGTGDKGTGGTGEYLERQERGREGGGGEREQKLKVDITLVLKANHIRHFWDATISDL